MYQPTDELITRFVDVIVPVAVPNLFTYRLLREHTDAAQPGARVLIQFGKTKVVTGVVVSVHENPPKAYQAKYVLEILDETPYFSEIHLRLFRWISQYYMCCIGEVLNIALPSGLKINSLSKIQLNPEFQHEELLTDREKLLLEEISKHQSLTYEELARLANVKDPNYTIKNLISKKAILVYEEVKDKYTPKLLKKLKLSTFYQDRDNLRSLLKYLEENKKQAQLAVILQYLKYIPVLHNAQTNANGLDKTILTHDENLSDSAISTLIKNEILEQFNVIISRFGEIEPTKSIPQLSDHQQDAYYSILRNFETKNVCLLHGITGSGKTEIYIRLVQEALDAGGQVLYLLPEIALTTQILQRLRKVFGDKVGIYHSKFTDNERVEVWRGIVEGKYNFVVGVRSAIFLPFKQLGLIIVDEEHESSYKQFDPAPRYHARDVAIVLANMHQAKVLLGSATPSIESSYQAKQGKYGYVALNQRFESFQLPDIQLIDLKKATHQKAIKGEYAEEILAAIYQNLERKQQTILFQNRRGYSPYIQCDTCGWSASCFQCDVSLTYHYKEAELRCHYCGHHEKMPNMCPSCGTARLKTRGFGTEKVEDDMALLFPTANIARMDLDTTRQKTSLATLIEGVEKGEIDILVGTQMVAKGLDFEKVSLVAIFDADRMIHYPDFRATERAYQLLTQVAGRAGRKLSNAKVLIQTHNTEHPLLRFVVQNDYESLYNQEITEREKFHYPPYGRLIHLTFKHQNQDECQKVAEYFKAKLLPSLGDARIKGPEKPVVDRIRDRFLYEILIVLEKNVNLTAVKQLIQEKINEIYADKSFKNIQIIVDVDWVG